MDFKCILRYVSKFNKTHEKMKLEVIRFSSQKDSTNGLLMDVTDEIKFLCYTLEDEHREDKIMSETRIPAGTYKLKLRKDQSHRL